MNTTSIDAVRVEPGSIKGPGDFCFDEDFKHIFIWTPGSSGPDAIQIQKGNQGGHRVWGWDGDIDKPTLTPSLLTPEWHGHLQRGKLKSC